MPISTKKRNSRPADLFLHWYGVVSHCEIDLGSRFADCLELRARHCSVFAVVSSAAGWPPWHDSRGWVLLLRQILAI